MDPVGSWPHAASLDALLRGSYKRGMALEMFQVEAEGLIPATASPSQSLPTALARVRAFATKHKFPVTERWLQFELTGYPGAPLHISLQVPETDPIVARIAGYRVIEGDFPVVFMTTAGPQPTQIPIYKFVSHSIVVLEQLLDEDTSLYRSKVPLSALPPSDITQSIIDQAHARGEDFLIADFGRHRFLGILGSLRREVVALLSDCLAGIRPA
ncbi:MAG: hypothetical protein JKY65_11475 [Planctomycetes bacterium]|nr:hypothetical protein [Planctomycetota bacterium]